MISIFAMPDIITEPGQYKTREGATVTVTRINKMRRFGCVGHYEGGLIENWHRSGRILESRETTNDIVEKIPSIKERLEYLRGELRAERISYDGLHELQSLAKHIDPGDVELLEAAGVPEK